MYPTVFFILLFIGFTSVSHAEPSLNFEELWQEVKVANPSIKEKDAFIKSIEKNPSLEIPAPGVSISQMNKDVPFSSAGKMQRTYEFSQSIPFITKFSKANEIKKTNIQKSNEENFLFQKELKLESYQAFLSYAKNQELKKILNEKLTFYENHLARSKSLQITNQAYQVRLLDIGIEISSLKSELKLKDIEIVEIKSLLNRLRNHDINDPFSEAEMPLLSSPSTYDQKGLLEHPALALNQSEIENMTKEKEMTKLDWAPDFNLKLRVIKNFDSQLKDGKEIMIGMTLPFIFPWQRNAKTESLSYKIRSQEYRGEQIKTQLNQNYATLNNKLKEQWILLSIYKEQNLPLVQRKIHLANKLTITDIEGLNERRNAIDQLFNLKSKIIEEEMNYRLSDFMLSELLNSNEGLQ